MTSFLPVAEQLAVIRRGVEKIVPEEELAQKLEHSRSTGRPLRVKYGIDPTGIDVHLGHTVPLRKMRQFQDLGHQAVIIIGNATAMVGDPSGRDKARSKQFTADEVEANARDYLQQVGKVVDLSKAEVHRNGDWFLTMAFGELLRLCGQVTVAQLLTRDDFAKRYAAQSPIFLHECLYPVMQAFDSVVIGADIELGGTEQLYSFMLARDLQREPQACALAERWMPPHVKDRRLKDGSLPQQLGVMSPILVGLDGVRRMGKSLGNYIGISEPPYEMMKKFMQVPDAVMRMYYELLTDVPLNEIEALLAGHPKEAKLRLGRTVIAQYHTDSVANDAVARWQREIGGGGLPDADTIQPYVVVRNHPRLNERNEMQPGFFLKDSGVCQGSNMVMTKLKEGAVFVVNNGQRRRLSDSKEWIPLYDGLIFGMGKKQIRRVQFVDPE
jgi:tyrosyl-tRNA synthetase